MTEKLPDRSEEIAAGAAALSVWRPFAVIGEALERIAAVEDK